MQEGGKSLGIRAYVAARNLVGSGAMDGLFAVLTPVVVMSVAGNLGLGDDYILLVVVGEFLARGDIAGTAFRASVNVDIFMLVYSLRNLAGSALMAYGSAWLLWSIIIVITVVFFVISKGLLLEDQLLVFFYDELLAP